jgi:hypothetical protein
MFASDYYNNISLYIYFFKALVKTIPGSTGAPENFVLSPNPSNAMVAAERG